MRGSDLRFTPEVYDERRAHFARRLESIVTYATAGDKCRSRVLLEYFGQKNAPSCNRCDVCVAARANTSDVQTSAQQNVNIPAVENLLADGELHPVEEFGKLNLSRSNLESLLRHLCNEEKIEIIDNKVRLKK